MLIESSLMKQRIMKKTSLLVGAFTICMSLGLFAACNHPQQKTEETKLVSLKTCPTSDAHLSVSVSEDRSQAVISRDGQVIQTITDEAEGLVSIGDNVPVRFLDANFDGFTDIFIGEGESRTYSTLLVWNDKTRQFERIGSLGSPSLQGFMLDMGSKSVVEGGSNSYCEFYITRSFWENGKLNMKEQLTIITDPHEYIINGVKNKFTLRDANERGLCSTETSDALPKVWQAIVTEYGY